MRNAKRKTKPKLPNVPEGSHLPELQEDPTHRMDILAKRLLEEAMKNCTDPALIFLYSRMKPGVEQAIEEFLGPMKTRRRRATQ